MRPCPQLAHLTESDIAKLVYRDNIKLKHSSRKRLADEISAKEPAVASLRDRYRFTDDQDPQQDDHEPLSKALVAYLLEVCYCVQNVCISFIVETYSSTKKTLRHYGILWFSIYIRITSE